ncbi:FGGY family carbohydrate kinase [Sciscionella marina]|uniref:FGGY family carbohydrate kinase n=1 Tax=Sciscionella marina TaxID=508770 RepID=UPI000368A34F|nr:FGGY family carbohydrate kinase [Sciscionella marina]
MAISAIVGIDAGTTAVKTVIITPDGRNLATARVPLEVGRPRPDCAEQSMATIWQSVQHTVTAALHAAGEVEVSAIGVTGQGDGAWLLDAEHRPIGPAKLWLDGRATTVVDEWERDGRAAAVHAVTGSTLFAGALPVLLEHLRPEARHQANCKDWIRLRLTGVLETDASEASRTYLDVRTGQYSQQLLDRLGHRRFAGLLPPVVPSTTTRPLRHDAAHALGLRPGTPVATGMVDTAAAGIGLGAVEPGESYAIMGTTAFLGTVRSSAEEVTAPASILLATGHHGRILECLCPMSGTPNLEWARGVTGDTHRSWTAVEAEAARVPPGADGVLYLPYGAQSGERAPFHAPEASAGWLGLSTSTSGAALLRAVYEGLAFSLRECQEALGGTGPLRLCGGATTSSLLCQTIAEVTGTTVYRATDEETGARGAAAIALSATEGTELARTAAKLRGEPRRFEPAEERTTDYERRYRIFRSVRDALRPQWSELRKLRGPEEQETTCPTVLAC